jgi:hypothetical protein
MMAFPRAGLARRQRCNCLANGMPAIGENEVQQWAPRVPVLCRSRLILQRLRTSWPLEIGSQGRKEPTMPRARHIAADDDVGRLLAVLRWCADRGADPAAVVEGRLPEAFEDPSFPRFGPTFSRGRDTEGGHDARGVAPDPGK